MRISKFVIMSLLSVLFACDNTDTALPKTIEMFTFPYDLSQPEMVYELPPVLTEISALTFVRDNILACIQDEDGIIFFYNLETNTIQERFVFNKSGDYEGIEKVGNIYYVLQSNGTIYEITDLGKSTQTTTIFETNLSIRHDTEGLGYDAQTNCLLIACKKKAGDGKHYEDKKAIYAFDLNTKRLTIEPTTLINKQDLYEYIESHDLKKLSFKLKKQMPFKPSGITAKNGFYYTIASIGNMLIVTDKSGNIQEVQAIDKSILPKPEGITFDNQNRMIISSEAKNGNGRIAVFSPLSSENH